MADVTPEQRAEWRDRAEFWTSRDPSTIGHLYDRHAVAFAGEVVALLDALDAAEARVAAAEREQAEYHRELHQAILGQAEREAQERIDAACDEVEAESYETGRTAGYDAGYKAGTREALERAVQAIGHDFHRTYGTVDQIGTCACRIVRDLMPRKDGE